MALRTKAKFINYIERIIFEEKLGYRSCEVLNVFIV